MEIRLFKTGDEKQIINLLRRNYLEINIKDYPLKMMKDLAKSHDEKYIIDLSMLSHLYVIEEDNKIIATGGVGYYKGNREIAFIINIYVLPEYQNKGYGRIMISTLENDEISKDAKMIRIESSITALSFYLKLGYKYKDNKKELNEKMLYILEKHL